MLHLYEPKFDSIGRLRFDQINIKEFEQDEGFKNYIKENCLNYESLDINNKINVANGYIDRK